MSNQYLPISDPPPEIKIESITIVRTTDPVLLVKVKPFNYIIYNVIFEYAIRHDNSPPSHLKSHLPLSRLPGQEGASAENYTTQDWAGIVNNKDIWDPCEEDCHVTLHFSIVYQDPSMDYLPQPLSRKYTMLVTGNLCSHWPSSPPPCNCP